MKFEGETNAQITLTFILVVTWLQRVSRVYSWLHVVLRFKTKMRVMTPV